jgi:hypothetical protein
MGVYFSPDITDEALLEYGILPVIEIGKNFDPLTQTLTGPVIEIGVIAVTYTYAAENKPVLLADVKAKAIVDITSIRNTALGTITNGSGLYAISKDNFSAATNLLAGNGSAILENGMTSEDYCTGLAEPSGLTALQFANKIVDGRKVNRLKAFQIEQAYLALKNNGLGSLGIVAINDLTTISAVETAVEAFKTLCLV